MPDAEICETSVVPDDDGAIVRLQISDVPLADEHTPAIRIVIEARLPTYKLPLLAHFQREAMQIASEALRKLGTDLGNDIGDTANPLRPALRR